MTFSLNSKKLFYSLTIFLIVQSLVAIVGMVINGRFPNYGFILLDVNNPNSIPTFVTSLLAFLAFLLAGVAIYSLRGDKMKQAMWLIMPFFFLLLAIDKGTGAHEAISFGQLFAMLGLPRMLKWAVFLGLVLAGGVVGLLFIRTLPRQVMWLVVASFGCTILGGFLFNEISGNYHYYVGEDFIYIVLSAVEEFVETFGIVLAIYAELLFLQGRFSQVQVAFVKETAVSQPIRHQQIAE